MTLAALREKFRQTARDDAAAGGNGLEGIYWLSAGVPLPDFVNSIPGEEVAKIVQMIEQGGIAAVYLGLGTRPAVIVGPAWGEVRFVQWQPNQGPVVRRMTSFPQFGDRDELIVLGHLLAWGAGDLLNPAEPTTKREYLREGAA